LDVQAVKEFDLSDGGLPQSDVIFDANGNLCGTASKGERIA
jgi:hypothetical protein